MNGDEINAIQVDGDRNNDGDNKNDDIPRSSGAESSSSYGIQTRKVKRSMLKILRCIFVNCKKC